MTAIQHGSEPWMPNGFPPASFVVETERTRTFAGSRGRWLAAAAILGALLLIAGLLLLAGQDDPDDQVTAGTSTSVGEVPGLPTSVLDPTATLPEATTIPGGAAFDPNVTTAPGGGGAAGGPGTTAAPGAPGAPVAPAAPAPGGAPGPGPGGVLTPSTGTVQLPTAFTARGPATGGLTLRNTGQGTLTFASRTSTGLTADPATGSIPPGATANIGLRLDGAGLQEGPYNGNIVFEGSGGTRNVQVKSTVAKPPAITNTGEPFVRTRPGTTACQEPWRIRANVSDATGIQSPVRVLITDDGGSTEFPMSPESVDSAGRGIWTIERPPETAPPNIRFVIRAVDTFGADAATPEQTLTC